jgi:thiosulfate dehydrogenase [quinone] large subunit
VDRRVTGSSLAQRIRTSPRLREPGFVLLPLRLFLGVTFVYAGALKLTDPAYLDPGSPNSVRAQMLHAATTSPIGAIVTLSAHAWLLTGLAIAFGELAVGMGVLLGLWTRVAALGGLLLSFSFFLTVSFHTTPYFFGSDIVFVFAWTAILLGGDGGVLTLPGVIRAGVLRRSGVRPGQRIRPSVAAEVERRTALRTGVVAAALGALAVVLGGASAVAARLRGSTPSAGALGAPSPAATTPSPTATPSGSPSGAPTGTPIARTAQVPTGTAQAFTDPVSGQPAYVVHSPTGPFEAFVAVCTHAGCTVTYQSGAFVCPCHASTFDGVTGAVLSGPAPSPLPRLPVQVEGGTIYRI